MSSQSGLTVTSAPYGTHLGQPITEYTLTNAATDGIQVQLIDYGGIITSVLQPDRHGVKKQVVLGYDHLAAWVSGMPWFNSLIGRHANRIQGGRFSIDGQVYQLEQNDHGNHLHGGAGGFNARVMASKAIQGTEREREFVGACLEFVSPDGDNGYPGELSVKAVVKLFGDNTLQLEFHGSVTGAATIVNLCNHAYWNLSGEAATAANTVLDHTLRLHAHSVTELESMVPTGRILPVDNTPYDFLTPRTIGSRMTDLDQTLPAPGGYDINFVLNKDVVEPAPEAHLAPREVLDGLRASFAARLIHPASGRAMDVYTTAPGVQVYTGNFLDGKSVVGRGGVAYPKHAGVCLETQSFPDAINHQHAFRHFPSPLLRPGDTYTHVTQHVFHTRAQ